MTTWLTAPSGLYTFDSQTGRAVPILAINQDGWGLTPGGSKTKQIYMLGAPEGDPAAADRVQTRTHSSDYMAAVRQAQLDGTPECPHGEPRGARYCPHCRRCRRTTWQASA